VEKVKNFQRNYLESEKFFTKFSYFFERENFQNLKVIESQKFSTKLYESDKFLLSLPKSESENFQNQKVVDLKVKIFGGT